MDLSHLWYREYFLNMTKCIQFPIALSMPWILVDTALQTKIIKENIMYPFEIYNDAAERALINQNVPFDQIFADRFFDQSTVKVAPDR